MKTKTLYAIQDKTTGDFLKIKPDVEKTYYDYEDEPFVSNIVKVSLNSSWPAVFTTRNKAVAFNLIKDGKHDQYSYKTILEYVDRKSLRVVRLKIEVPGGRRIASHSRKSPPN